MKVFCIALVIFMFAIILMLPGSSGVRAQDETATETPTATATPTETCTPTATLLYDYQRTVTLGDMFVINTLTICGLIFYPLLVIIVVLLIVNPRRQAK